MDPTQSLTLSRSKHSILLVFVLLCLVQSTAARTLYVGGPRSQYARISAAIRAAQPHDIILVQGGKTFHEQLTIGKPLTLRGVGQPEINGDRRGNVISVKSDHVRLEGLRVTNSNRSSLHDYCGVKAEDSNFLVILNCTFRSNQFSIMVQNSTAGTISHNDIESDITENPVMGNAVHAWKCDSMNIVDNRIGHNRDGIYLEYTEHSHIARNRIVGCERYGLHFMFSHYNTYYQNYFAHNRAGVAVMYAHHVTMLRNTFAENEGTSSYGLLIKELQYSHIRGNLFRRNTVGLMVDGGADLVIEGNQIQGNGWGFRLVSGSSNVRVKHNNFIDNTFDMASAASFYNNNVDCNYWDEYSGYDLNHDHVGDVPFHPLSLFSTLAEKNETVLLFFRSFLMNLLDATEKIVPSLTPDVYVDNKPSMIPYKI